ncbi:MAG: hypothetical protein WEG36_05770 [Gemmatimonadota bacterium]
MAPEAWNADDLASLVETAHGTDRAHAARQVARAMVREGRYAELHARQFLALADSVDTSGHRDPGRGAMVTMARALERLPGGESFSEGRLAGGAHLLALVRSLHVAVDLCATVVFEALDVERLSGGRLTLRSVYPVKVEEALRSARAHEPVADALKALREGESVVYVKDVSNASKHRTLVEVPYTVSMKFDGSGSPYGVRVAAFSFDGREHPAR